MGTYELLLWSICSFFYLFSVGKSSLILEILKYKDTFFDRKFSRIVICAKSIRGHKTSKFINTAKELCDDILIETYEGDLN